MEVELMTYTPNALKVCAISMRSTRTKEAAHVLWRKHRWTIHCAQRRQFDWKTVQCGDCSKRKTCCIRLVDDAKKRKHYGVLEHATFTISVSGISRACTHQLVRHRLFSYLQSSSRAINFDELTLADFIYPPSLEEGGLLINLDDSKVTTYNKALKDATSAYVKLRTQGVPREDARFVLPQAVPQHIVITGNARNWMHFFYMRLSEHAQWEIREMTRLILERLVAVAPYLFDGAGELEV